MKIDELSERLKPYLWAKSEPFKPLWIHMLESGVIAQILLTKGCFKPLLYELHARMGLSEKKICALVGYLVAMHDIGKIHPSFVGNGVYKQAETFMQENALRPPICQAFRHEKYAALLLRNLWQDGNRFPDRKIRNVFRTIIRYHHQGKRGSDGRMDRDRERIWFNLQRQFEEKLYQIFQPPTKFKVNHIDSVCMTILGIMIVSDWIASGSTFAFTPINEDEKSVVKRTKKLAFEFLKSNQMLHMDPPDTITKFTQLWPQIPENGLRPLQQITEKLFMDENEKPLAIIMEAPMGEGKTEAALFAALRLAQRWHKDGFYIALPTAATSNQMFDRVNTMLQGLKLSNAKLMHAMAWLMDDNVGDKFTGDCSSEAELWTAPLRRGLIAPFAVGTVDQVMMAAMRTKYGALRLAGLIQKVLIIDELHSYDAYMSSIIVNLLKWCKVLHIPVIMLSATLPTEKKKEFAACYMQNDCKLQEGIYPGITLFYEEKPAKQVKVPGSHQHMNLMIEELPYLHNIERLAEFIKCQMQKTSGCFCVLRNTVKEAQETYQAILKSCPDIPIILFHARFTAKRRKEIEKQCIEYFSIDKTKRPKRIILVATQVVEQSLDLDFDYIITDICPIDLLLQRAGRLWRHGDTDRPVGIKGPRLTVLVPAQSENYGPSEMVYDKVILKLSQQVISTRKTISLPQDIPTLVEKVYSGMNITPNLEDSWLEYNMNESLKDSNATMQKLPEPDVNNFCFESGDNIFFADDDSEFLPARTRLGEPSTRIAFLPDTLFHKVVNNERPERSLIKEVLQYSVGISQKRVSWLNERSCSDGTEVIEGTGLLQGIWLLRSDKGICKFKNGKVIKMDNNLGLLIEGGI